MRSSMPRDNASPVVPNGASPTQPVCRRCCAWPANRSRAIVRSLLNGVSIGAITPPSGSGSFGIEDPPAQKCATLAIFSSITALVHLDTRRPLFRSVGTSVTGGGTPERHDPREPLIGWTPAGRGSTLGGDGDEDGAALPHHHARLPDEPAGFASHGRPPGRHGLSADRRSRGRGHHPAQYLYHPRGRR